MDRVTVTGTSTSDVSVVTVLTRLFSNGPLRELATLFSHAGLGATLYCRDHT